MAFIRPVVDTEISASTFGQPVYDALQRTGGTWRRNAVQSIPVGNWTQITFDTEIADTGGFLTPPATTITVPAAAAGIWGVMLSCYVGGPQATLSLQVSGVVDNLATGGDSVTGAATITYFGPIPAGGTIAGRIFNNTTAAVNAVGRLDAWRVGI